MAWSALEDSGEGRWTANAAVEEAVPADVLSAALYARFRSRDRDSAVNKLLWACGMPTAGMSSRGDNDV